jgi:Ca2+-binding EF-hand superfamily protein
MISGTSSASSFDTAALKQMREQMFSRLDANGDGSVDAAEFKAGAPSKDAAAKSDQLFAAFDTDGDGSLTKTEVESGFEKMHSAMKSVLLGAQEASGSDDNSDELFSALDTDGDGTLTKAEWEAGLDKLRPPPGAEPTDDANASGSSSTEDALLKLLDQLKANSDATANGAEASGRQDLLSVLLGLQEQMSQAA